MQFSFPAELVYPAMLSLGFPVTLLLVSRVPALKSRNAAQFLIAALLHFVIWLIGSLLLPRPYRLTDWSAWTISAMVLVSFVLIYLEAWALLSRGYTLSMLLVLLDSYSPLTASEIASRYRGGDGLDWILRHRLGGLEAAGLIRKQGSNLALDPRRGLLVVALYRTAITVFGLRKTG